MVNQGRVPYHEHDDKDVRAALAQALGERKVRLTDRRLLILFLAFVAGLVWLGAQQQSLTSAQHRFDRQARQLVVTCETTQGNVETLNTAMDRLRQAAEANPAYSPAIRRARATAYAQLHQKVATCPPRDDNDAAGRRVDSRPAWDWNAWVPPGMVTADASFGDNPLFDWIRVGCVVLAVVLIGAIGRVLLEARRRPQHKMPRTQVARFAALILAMPYVVLTELSVLGTTATPRLFDGVALLAAAVYGVHGMRRKQRANPPPRR